MTAPTHRWGWATVPVATVVAAVGVIGSGFRENPYLTHVRDIAPQLQPYPMKEVAFILGLMAIQALLVTALIHATGREGSWQRALAAAAVSGGFVAVAVAGSMHISPSWTAFALWTLVMLVWMTALVVIRALRVRHP